MSTIRFLTLISMAACSMLTAAPGFAATDAPQPALSAPAKDTQLQLPDSHEAAQAATSSHQDEHANEVKHDDNPVKSDHDVD